MLSDRMPARRSRPSLGLTLGISKTNVGAVAEMLVSADLLSRGYSVFRALSSACSCDLVAFKGESGTPRKIEVKVAQVNATTGKVYPPVIKTGRFDVLAIVLPDHSITYEPEMP